MQGQALEGVPPRGLYSLWKRKARSRAKSHAADGVVEEEYEGGRLGEAGRVIVAKPGTLDVPCPAELASRSQQSQGTGQVWGMKIGGPGQGLQGGWGVLGHQVGLSKQRADLFSWVRYRLERP